MSEKKSTFLEWVLLSAGQGVRMGLPRPKTLMPLHGQPLFLFSVAKALQHSQTRMVVIVTAEDTAEEHHAAWSDFYRRLNWDVQPLSLPHAYQVKVGTEAGATLFFCVGGARRQDSVRRGLAALAEKLTPEQQKESTALIHDTARPFLSPTVCQALVKEVAGGRGAVPVLPVPDTMKEVDLETGLILKTIARERLARAQTPQAFRFCDIHHIHQDSRWMLETATDDAQMAEAFGVEMKTVAGAESMRKLTTKEDWLWAQNQITAPGLGWDTPTISTH